MDTTSVRAMLQTLAAGVLCQTFAFDIARAQDATTVLRPALPAIDQVSSGAGLQPNVDTAALPANDSGVRTPATLQTPSQNRAILGRTNLRSTSVGPRGLIDINGALRPLANRPAQPIQGRGGNREANPYAALGVPVGRFRVFPVFEQSIGFTTNAEQASNGASAAFSQTEGRVRFQSDWSVHELRGEFGASTIQYLGSDAEAVLAGDAQAELRLDFERGTAARIGINYALSSENIASQSLDAGTGQVVSDRPSLQTYGAFASIQRTGGRLSGRLLGSLDRNTFGTLDLADGSALSQSDRNQVEARVALRVGYEVSPAITPFVEASLGRRMFDNEVDADGIRRDAMLYDFRGGIALDLRNRLRGELALGYGLETYDDAILDNLSGFTINGSLVWSPQQFMQVTAEASTQLNGPSGLNDSASITYASALQVDREIRANLQFNGRVAAAWQDFDNGRSDTTLQAEAGLTWYLNRSFALTGRLGYESVDSSDAGAGYDAATARIGLRVQR